MGGVKKEMLKGSVTAVLLSSLAAKEFCVQHGRMVGGGIAPLKSQLVVKLLLVCPPAL